MTQPISANWVKQGGHMAEKDIGYLGSDEWAPPPINIINFDNYRINNKWSGSSSSSSSNHEIVEYDEDEDDDDDDDGPYGRLTIMPSITEEYDDSDANRFSNRNGNDVVYVVTWKGTEELSSASMDALLWTLGSDLRESTIVYLIHVFPELRYIPTPLGRLPISQANLMQKENCLVHERRKRSEYLQRFLSLCSSSKVQVETVLIESDMEAKAILDLIPILNITTLVMGATKSTLRKMRGSSKKGGRGTLDQILHSAPESCEVKIICEGKEVSLQDQSATESTTPSLTAQSPRDNNVNGLKPMPNDAYGHVNCSCFKL